MFLARALACRPPLRHNHANESLLGAGGHPTTTGELGRRIGRAWHPVPAPGLRAQRAMYRIRRMNHEY